MEHAPAVRVGDRLADVDESVEQVPQRPHTLVGVAARVGVGPMKLADRFFEADPPDESHRIKRAAVDVFAQPVDGDNPRVLEPARDFGFQREPGAAIGVVGAFGLDLLQRHLALELRIEGHRDLADAPLGMGPEDPEPLPLGGGFPEGLLGVRIDRRFVVRDLDRAGQERVVLVVSGGRRRVESGFVTPAVHRDRRQGRVGAEVAGFG